MGLFSIFKNNSTERKEIGRKTPRENQSEILEKLMQEQLEQLPETRLHLTEAKQEYMAVSAYLMDIQKIEAIPEEDRNVLNDAARNIISLNKERKSYQHTEKKLAPAHYQRMQRYEKEIPKQLKRLEEQERYQQLIRNDMKQLEGEKGWLLYEKEECKRRIEFIKKLSIYGCVMVAVVFMVLLYLAQNLKINLSLPFFFTGLMGLAIIAYVVLESSRTRKEHKLTDLKINRAILLMNKVKLKFVNCINTLDYGYEKYGVNSHQELGYIWNKFVKEQEEENRYRKSTEILQYYHSVLMNELMQYQVSDPEVWIYQPEALFDQKEMVEVRHRLNERRMKLRDQISRLMEQIETVEDLEGN